MTRFHLTRHRRQDDALLDYWDAVVREQPATPVTPADVPGDLASLVRALEATAEAGRKPRTYQDDLLETLLNRYEETTPMTATTAAGTIPHAPLLPSSPAGVRDSVPVSRRRATVPDGRAGWPLRPIIAIGLVILLVLASAGGGWWLANRNDEPHRLMAPAAIQSPDDTTAPQDASDHPIVGAWDSANGIPCWCITVLTADGLSFGIDPNPVSSTSGISSQSVAMGFWYPTGERTAVSIVRFPADDGGYVERTLTLEVSEDGSTVAASGSQRVIGPDGKVSRSPNAPPIEMVRMTAPDEELSGTPAS